MKYCNNYLPSTNTAVSSRAYRISPATVLVMILINTLALINKEFFLYLAFLSIAFAVLFVLNRDKFLKMAPAYLLIQIYVNLAGENLINGPWLGAIYTMTLMLMRIYSILVLSAAMMTYDTSVIINILRKVKIPNHLAISVAIFFRFLPEYFSYIEEINEGAKVRGIQASIRRPIKSLERYIVPLIYKAFETGDILTSSLLTKGIEYDCRKTSYRDLSLQAFDVFLIILEAGLLGVIIWKSL